MSANSRSAAGSLQLLAPEEDVAEPGQDSVVSSAGCAAGWASGAGLFAAGPISFGGSPEPTSALSFASSSSTWRGGRDLRELAVELRLVAGGEVLERAGST